jgi:hypothetical protein
MASSKSNAPESDQYPDIPSDAHNVQSGWKIQDVRPGGGERGGTDYEVIAIIDNGAHRSPDGSMFYPGWMSSGAQGDPDND